jgi:hypothetical protein
MKSQGIHAHEDRLLDFAYGELPPTEAEVVERHVRGCSRCSETLDDIRGVRVTMSRLPLQSAPDTGLESLMAYAQQAARRNAAGPEPTPRWWRRFLAPVMGLAAMSVFGIVVHQVNREVDLTPSLQKEAAQPVSSRQEKRDVPAPATAAPAPTPAAPAVSPTAGLLHAQLDEEHHAEKEREQAVQKRAPSKKSPGYTQRMDWSNAGSAGGFPDKKGVSFDEDVSGLAELGTKDAVKSKRGAASASGGRTALSTAQPSEPVRNEAPADDVEAAPAAEASGPPSAPKESKVAEYDAATQRSRIVGSASRPSAAVASRDYAQQAPERSQAAMAPPPPPPAQAQAPEAMASKAEVAQQVRAKPAAPRPSPAELLRRAEEASGSGDRAEEAELLRSALAAGAQGAQRLEALSRLCEVESALGRRQSAIEVCKRVMSEAPGSSEARLARRRLERELSAE